MATTYAFRGAARAFPPLRAAEWASRLTVLPPPVDTSVVKDQHVAQFAEDGAFVLRNVFPTEWVEALRDAAEANMRSPGPLCDEHASAQGVAGRFHDDQFLWLRHEAFHAYVTKSGAAAIAAKAMGSLSAHIFYDQLLVKEPGTSTPTPWHNDTSYWHLDGTQICSLWVALDTVPATNGVGYIKGSHTWNLRHAVTNFSGDAHSQRNTYDTVDTSKFDELPDIDAGVASGKYELLRWDMEPGDVIIFNSYSVHGAPGMPKGSSLRRRGYASRWCGDDVRFADRPGTMHDGWKASGFDAGLANGDPVTCDLHPNILTSAA